MANSAIEGAYTSLLQGVSQQVPRLRLDGQLTKQENMLADPVTNLRRRTGTPLLATFDFRSVTSTDLYTQYLERGSDGRNLVINTSSGNWWILNKAGNAVVTSGQDNYFKASAGSSSIQVTSVGGETFILNIEEAPNTITNGTGKQDPATTGWYFTKVGAFSKDYNITVVQGGKSYSATYSTPTGTTDGDVAKATPTYITTQLINGLKTAGATGITQSDMYMFVKGAATVSVSSTSGSTYVGFSGTSNVALVTDLPAVLPSAADGAIMSVGTNQNAYAWYRWDAATSSWQEDSAYGSPTSITNMPRVLVVGSDTITSPAFEGRLSGDDNTNENPTFVEQGVITGMTTYQGRLILLSGAFVSMSKSGNPYRFYRSTVTELEASDRIDVGIGSSQNSILRRGIQFNRDLVLFGDSIQAVVTGSGNIVTPSNAAISLTSEESCDSKIAPVQAGQTVLYPFKRSANYSGMLELIPSQYTSSQYVSQDNTGHLPEFMQGSIRFTTASNVVNMCLFGCSGDLRKLVVHEYQWGNDGKTQAAWHTWTFPMDVASVHFARERIILFLVNSDGSIHTVAIDPREGYDQQSTTKQPYLDLYSAVTLSNRILTVPDHLINYAASGGKLALASADGTYVTEEVGVSSISSDGKTLTTVRGVPNGKYYIGIKFISALTPTPVILKDSNGKEMGAGHVRLVRLELAVRNTGIFTATVDDDRTDVDSVCEYTGLFLNSPELEPNYPMIIGQANIIIPCRTLADTTEVTLSTDGTHDMNIIDVSYLLRYNQRHRRI